MNLQPMKNEESWHQSEDEDEGIDRNWWVAQCCPAKDCSKNAWKKAACWSYDSEDKVKCYIMNHLMGSGVHDKDHDEALDLAVNASIENFVETARDRAKYRRQCQLGEKQSKENRPRSRSRGSSRGSSRGNGNSRDKDTGKKQIKNKENTELRDDMAQMQENMAKIAQVLVPLTQGHTFSGSASSSSTPALLAPQPKTRSAPIALPVVPRCDITVANLRLLESSLGRAYFAANKGHILLEQMASQIEKEAKVIRQAQMAVRQCLYNTEATVTGQHENTVTFR
jgi:hypothetical protein